MLVKGALVVRQWDLIYRINLLTYLDLRTLFVIKTLLVIDTHAVKCQLRLYVYI